MSPQIKMYRKKWQKLTFIEKRLWQIRIIASTIVFILGCAMIFNMRSQLIGEDGASMAMYSLGTLFILSMNLMIFGGKIRTPESLALKLCIAAIIVTSAWVNIEEKLVMPLVASDCDNDCVLVYERAIPFSDSFTIYTEERGWRILK